ncbi:TPA: fructose 1,6-bisphosphatase, partial [Candidatus Bathyarchaeota archaeon]|nr:fructose 1,6-bisphosphatase [Candidatus Bathyarchaeota archaeon]
MAEKTTVSLVKCDVGSLCGHHVVPPEIKDVGRQRLDKAEEEGFIDDFFVFNCGDDLELLMSHRLGANNPTIHKLAWDTFLAAVEKAKEMKLYGAGQDILRTAFSGNVRGMGPGVAEMEIVERRSEPLVVLAADKT